MEAGSLRVLVADDDEMVLRVARLMLETAGFEVLVACDGQEAVDVFREQGDTIDLVLLDMTMPRLERRGGFEQIRTYATGRAGDPLERLHASRRPRAARRRGRGGLLA